MWNHTTSSSLQALPLSHVNLTIQQAETRSVLLATLPQGPLPDLYANSVETQPNKRIFLELENALSPSIRLLLPHPSFEYVVHLLLPIRSQVPMGRRIFQSLPSLKSPWVYRDGKVLVIFRVARDSHLAQIVASSFKRNWDLVQRQVSGLLETACRILFHVGAAGTITLSRY